jgi:nucleoside-diphosphate-sugar epimerase
VGKVHPEQTRGGIRAPVSPARDTAVGDHAAALGAAAEALALARSRERATRLLPAHQRLRIIEGDITDTSTFAGHLPGAGAIIHTAAYFREYHQPGGNDPTQLQRINVEAVANLLRAAAGVGVSAVVHTSSAASIGTRADGQPASEDAAG